MAAYSRRKTTVVQRTVYMDIGERVVLARVEANMSQAELAANVGLVRASITNLEAGRQKVQLDTLYDIAEWLDVDIYDLLPKRREC